jgi:hypothetical protein
MENLHLVQQMMCALSSTGCASAPFQAFHLVLVFSPKFPKVSQLLWIKDGLREANPQDKFFASDKIFLLEKWPV